MYVSIGYPLGYAKDENGKVCYMLEISVENSLKIINLTYQEFRLWVAVAKQEKDIENELIKLLPILKEKGALIEANMLSGLLEKALTLNPIRAGVGWRDDTLKECIFINKEFVYLTKMQLDIWRLSTGANKLVSVFNWQLKQSDKPLEIFEKEFMLAVMELMIKNVLALR